MQFLKIVGMATVAAVLYSIVLDEVAVYISPRSFTDFPPHVLFANALSLSALAGGVVSAWWAGLIMGILLAAAARVGREPRIDSRELVRPIAVLLAVVALGSVLAGYWQYRKGSIIDGNITAKEGARIFAVYMAQGASWILGFSGSLLLCAWIVIRRVSRSRIHPVHASGLPISQ